MSAASPLLRAWLCACLLMCCTVLRADIAVPPLRSPVTDLTQTLTPEQSAALEQKLRAFEARKGSQIAVLLVPTTEPESIEQYSIRVAEAWKLGRKGVDDGALLLIAKNDRAVRIEVGYGLEGVVTDAAANRMVDQLIVPRFRSGDFYGGINDGVDRLIRAVDGEPLPEPTRASRSTERSSRGLGSLLPLLLVLAVVGGGILRTMFGRLGGAAVTGGLVGFIVWSLASVAALAAIAGLIAFVVALLGGGSGMGRGGFGGFGGMGGWSGRGGGFGGGFGGGGWSGGGGGFGGGGASGRW